MHSITQLCYNATVYGIQHVQCWDLLTADLISTQCSAPQYQDTVTLTRLQQNLGLFLVFGRIAIYQVNQV